MSKGKTIIKGGPIKFNSHQDCAIFVTQLVHDLVCLAEHRVSQVDKDQRWLLYARAMNSLFQRLYNPAIFHTMQVNTDIEDKLDGQFTKPKSPNKTRRFKIKNKR